MAPIQADPSELTELALLVRILERVDHMSKTADDTAAAVAAENAKVDQLLALLGPAFQALRDANAALQTQVDALKAGDTVDAATMQAALDASNAETAKVQAAIDQISPPPAG